ncbi:hypothetical protein D3C76_1750680 [compost metagenome]
MIRPENRSTITLLKRIMPSLFSIKKAHSPVRILIWELITKLNSSIRKKAAHTCGSRGN